MALTPQEILNMILAHNRGVPTTQIATDFDVDPSTVRYHVDKFVFTYGSTDAVYALIRPVQRICPHPSFKCLVCGKAHDAIHREELEEIERLRSKLIEHGLLTEGDGV